MRKLMVISLVVLPAFILAQYTGIGTLNPQSRLHVNGTSWFQGDNTPLAANAGTGIALGYVPGATGGYVFAFNYTDFTARNLWLNHPGGSVIVNSTTTSPLGRLDVRGGTARGIYASSTTQPAVYATSSGAEGINVSSSAGHGLITYSSISLGLYAVSGASGSGGILGESNYIGTQGTAAGTDVNRQGIRGEVTGGGYAGLFSGGTTWVVGTLQKNAGSFFIDHPLEPETKFLIHSFVESPDMKNIYDGITTTDNQGFATVEMPEWFEALNMDFRYQLTCIGQFANAIVSREIADNVFVIQTDKPNVKISWQVTGTRHDPYAVDKRIEVERLKTPDEIGKYIYPQGYGKTDEDLLPILKPVKGNYKSGMAEAARTTN